MGKLAYMNRTTEPDFSSFGRRLRWAREMRGLKQHHLATATGVKRPNVSNWERDLNKAEGRRLEILATLLQVDKRWLDIGGGDPYRQHAPSGKTLSSKIILDTKRIRDESPGDYELHSQIARLEALLRSGQMTGAQLKSILDLVCNLTQDRPE